MAAIRIACFYCLLEIVNGHLGLLLSDGTQAPPVQIHHRVGRLGIEKGSSGSTTDDDRRRTAGNPQLET